MKIIEVKSPKPDTKRVTCGKCKSKLEITPQDIQSDRDGRYYVCPVCQQFNAAH